jgi:hypothetical protein
MKRRVRILCEMIKKCIIIINEQFFSQSLLLIHLFHTPIHTQTDLPLALHQRRQSQVDGATDRLPYFDVQSGFMCQSCHASPHQLATEYIYGTSKSFETHQAKSCPSREEGSTASAIATTCYYQALSVNRTLKPSNVLACSDPASQLLGGAAATDRNKANWSIAKNMVQASIGDRRPKQGAEGRGSVASLSEADSGAFWYHSVCLTQLGIAQYVDDCVSDMETFTSAFAKPGASPLSEGTSLGNREQRVVDAVLTWLAGVNERLSAKDDSTAARRDAIGEKDSEKSHRGLF